MKFLKKGNGAKTQCGREMTPGMWGEVRGTRTRRLQEVSSREVAESRARVPAPSGAPTLGKFLESGVDILLLPVVETGAAQARRNPRTPRNPRGAERAALRSGNGPLEVGTKEGRMTNVIGETPRWTARHPVASASRHQPERRTVRVLQNRKVNGWSRR